MFSRQTAIVRSCAERKISLGGYDDLVTTSHVPDSAAENLLACPDRVHIRGIKKIDPVVQGALEKTSSVLFR